MEEQADQQVGSSDNVLHKGGKDNQASRTGFPDSIWKADYVSWFGLGCGILQGKKAWCVRSLSADHKEEVPTIWRHLAEERQQPAEKQPGPAERAGARGDCLRQLGDRQHGSPHGERRCRPAGLQAGLRRERT